MAKASGYRAAMVANVLSWLAGCGFEIVTACSLHPG